MAPQLVSVKNCSNPFEAEFVKSYLGAHGIVARIDNEDSMRWTGRYAVMGRGVRVWVHPKDAAQARKLLDQTPEPAAGIEDGQDKETWAEGEEQNHVEEQEKPAPHCPNCCSQQVAEAKPPRWTRIVVNIALLGLPLLFSPRKWSCTQCGWHWSE